MSIQSDARPLTKPVGSARLGKGGYERFSVRSDVPEAVDRVGESTAGSRIPAQKYFDFFIYYLGTHRMCASCTVCAIARVDGG
ncbi:MAG TPA: hypothetical protein VKU01_37125 [Bryobacteraceae bacterium]|nr:hypothetical protein [Bryobacteraceae bacterium]